ncbi:MAG TPA: CPBP family intramembrane metalloprotease [Chloroflexi bacterium]|jgi:membrane protease YdiL (CAAX protease family)|nr:CPBP family intramembrane metalloprotease [Chloroflexota bacterium]
MASPPSPDSRRPHPLLRPFWNHHERRLRLFWRLLGMAILLFIVSILLGLALFAMGLVDSFPAQMVLTLLSTVGSMALAGWALDRRRFADYGLHLNRTWWTDFAFGLGLGVLLMAGIFAISWAAGWVVVVDTLVTATPGVPFARALLVPILLFLAVGIYEEMLLRGYLLRNLAEGLNMRWISSRGAVIAAWVLSSVVFGVLHATNPNSTVISTINLSLAGIFLGLGYVLTKSLAIPIGLHITWNLFQGTVFGFPVSGVQFGEARFLVIQQTGPEAWTGGAFGPEAGLSGILAMVVGSLLTVWWVARRHGRALVQSGLAEYPARAGTTNDRPLVP